MIPLFQSEGRLGSAVDVPAQDRPSFDPLFAHQRCIWRSTLERPAVLGEKYGVTFRMMLDLYHAQIGEGNLTELVRAALPWVGGNPGDRRPGPVVSQAPGKATTAQLRAPSAKPVTQEPGISVLSLGSC